MTIKKYYYYIVCKEKNMILVRFFERDKKRKPFTKKEVIGHFEISNDFKKIETKMDKYNFLFFLKEVINGSFIGYTITDIKKYNEVRAKDKINFRKTLIINEKTPMENLRKLEKEYNVDIVKVSIITEKK